MASIFYGLMSALIWGAGDFAGGMASRKTGAIRVVFFAEIVGILMLISPALAVEKIIPPLPSVLQAMLAGALGSLGLLLLYQALATGSMSIAAPVSALMAGVLPVALGIATEGNPGALVLMGFALALLAIWLVSQGQDGTRHILAHLADLRLPILAGIGFGCFFVLIHGASRTSTFWPMLSSRLGGLLIVGLFMLVRRDSFKVVRGAWPIIVLNGILDVGGNAFYILAGQTGRLDVSAVLSSLYPAGTVMLAWFLLKERLSRTQWLGIGAALIAIVLFTL